MIEAGEYQGVKIYLGSLGEFVANIDGVGVTAPSMASMRKKISAAKEVTFEPFDAISNYYNNEVRLASIVGIRKSNVRAHRSTRVFVDSNGQEYRTVLPATAENIALCKNDMKVRDDCQNEIKRQRRLMDVAHEAIIVVNAEQYLADAAAKKKGEQA